ncbi:alpha/beta hydrolase [Streptomyces sp. NPDC002851]
MRTRRVIAGAAVLALVGAGAPTSAMERVAERDRGDKQPDLTRFYGQKISWGKCDDVLDAMDVPKDMTCGQVTVPLDYANPKKGTVDLVLNRIPASGKKRGSLLVNFGGPGGAGVAGLAGMERNFDSLTEGYDVIGFDPRGVGQSSPVTCGEGVDDDELQGSGTDQDSGAFEIERLKKQYEICKKYSGPVLEHIGTVNVSRDLDVMRQVLGDDKLNYLGFSYGTRLGAVYAAQFPHKVGRMVLDGVDTLTEPMPEQQRVSAAGQQTALDNFVTWCSANGGCVLGSNSRDAKENVRKLIDQLNDRPITLGEGAVYDGDALVGALGSALYQRSAWPYLSQALSNVVEDRDPRALLRLQGAQIPPPDDDAADSSGTESSGVGASGERSSGESVTGAARKARDAGDPPLKQSQVPVDNEDTALIAVNCADDPDRLTAAQLDDEKWGEQLFQEFTEASPVFGPSRLFTVLMCAGQPKGTDYIRKIRNVDTDSRFLLVGTRGDPATPYQWAVETQKRLGSQAVLLDNQGEGHGAYLASKCVQQKVDEYLLYGRGLARNTLYCPEE